MASGKKRTQQLIEKLLNEKADKVLKEEASAARAVARRTAIKEVVAKVECSEQWRMAKDSDNGDWLYKKAIEMQLMGLPLTFDNTLKILINAWIWGLNHPNMEEALGLDKKGWSVKYMSAPKDSFNIRRDDE